MLIKQNEAEKETSQSNSTENRAKVRNKIEQFNPFDFYQRTEVTCYENKIMITFYCINFTITRQQLTMKLNSIASTQRNHSDASYC